MVHRLSIDGGGKLQFHTEEDFVGHGRISICGGVQEVAAVVSSISWSPCVNWVWPRRDPRWKRPSCEPRLSRSEAELRSDSVAAAGIARWLFGRKKRPRSPRHRGENGHGVGYCQRQGGEVAARQVAAAARLAGRGWIGRPRQEGVGAEIEEEESPEGFDSESLAGEEARDEGKAEAGLLFQGHQRQRERLQGSV